MYRSLRWGKDLELIVIDARTFRARSSEELCATADGAPDVLPLAAAPDAPENIRGIRAFVQLPPEAPPGCLDDINRPQRSMLGAAQKAFLYDRLLNSDATWRVIVNPVPVQQYLAQPYDRWEGYAAERREILRFIRDNAIPNVVFLTTDAHASIFGPVSVDMFTDDAAVAYEAIVGPIAATPLEQEIVDVLGEEGGGLFGSFLTGVAGVECAELASYAYGLAELDATRMTITAKDAAGATLCAKTLEAAPPAAAP
jgi:phosphodiesterase/alkaline phosphatase D-like protein